MQVIKEEILTVNQAHNLLKERQKEGNLSYEQQNTLNYLEDLVKLDSKTHDKLLKELLEAAGLNSWQASKVVDLLPKKEDVLKIILTSGGPVNDETVKKVFEIIKKYRKDAKEPAKTKKVEVAEQKEEKKQEETTEE